MQRAAAGAKARRVLALDLDGVLYNHPRVARYVANRCVRYVAEELRISMAEAEPLNAMLYHEYGHTLRGMNKMFRTRRTLQHFNSHVYDQDTLGCIARHAKDPAHVNRTHDARDALRRCQAGGVDVYVFSNAPAVWCEATLDAMGFLDRFVPRTHVVSGDHGVSKPACEAYQAFAKVAGIGSSGGRDAVFVDDTLRNLLPLLRAPSWIPVHYHCDIEHQWLPQRVLEERAGLRQVRSLAEVMETVVFAEAAGAPSR